MFSQLTNWNYSPIKPAFPSSAFFYKLNFCSWDECDSRWLRNGHVLEIRLLGFSKSHNTIPRSLPCVPPALAGAHRQGTSPGAVVIAKQITPRAVADLSPESLISKRQPLIFPLLPTRWAFWNRPTILLHSADALEWVTRTSSQVLLSNCVSSFFSRFQPSSKQSSRTSRCYSFSAKLNVLTQTSD